MQKANLKTQNDIFAEIKQQNSMVEKRKGKIIKIFEYLIGS